MEGGPGSDGHLRRGGPGRGRRLLRPRDPAGLPGNRPQREARREDPLRPGETLLRSRRRSRRARRPGVVAYRRQRVDEAGTHREATRLHTERFSQAVEQLGSDSPAVRLGGIHALAGLADDAPDHSQRQTCVDVLCAYLRLPSPPNPGDPPDATSTEEQREAHQDKKDRYLALREVRHTILRLIGDHYRIPQGSHRSWQGCDLDLTRVTIDGDMNFRGATFSGGVVSFERASGQAPEGLLAAVNVAAPQTVVLPPSWLPHHG